MGRVILRKFPFYEWQAFFYLLRLVFVLLYNCPIAPVLTGSSYQNKIIYRSNSLPFDFNLGVQCGIVLLVLLVSSLVHRMYTTLLYAALYSDFDTRDHPAFARHDDRDLDYLNMKSEATTLAATFARNIGGKALSAVLMEGLNCTAFKTIRGQPLGFKVNNDIRTYVCHTWKSLSPFIPKNRINPPILRPI